CLEVAGASSTCCKQERKYRATRASYSHRGRYLGESISEPFSCPAMDDPGYAGSVAKLLSFATAVSGARITRARAVAKICRETETFCDKFCDTSGPLASWQDPARARRLCARLNRRSGPHAPAHRAEAGRVQTPLRGEGLGCEARPARVDAHARPAPGGRRRRGRPARPALRRRRRVPVDM